MSFIIPPQDHPLRESLDLAHVAEVLDRRNLDKLSDFAQAIRSARRTIEANPGVRSVDVICMRADDERWLVRVGARGGWRKLWNFGRGR